MIETFLIFLGLLYCILWFGGLYSLSTTTGDEVGVLRLCHMCALVQGEIGGFGFVINYILYWLFYPVWFMISDMLDVDIDKLGGEYVQELEDEINKCEEGEDK